MSKNEKRTSILSKTRIQLSKLLPQKSELDIRYEREPSGEYTSIIEVFTVKKHLIAKKTNSNFKKAMEKTKLAIAHQINKLKHERRRKINKFHSLYREASL